MCEAYVIPFLFGSFFTVCHPYIDVHFLKCFFCYFVIYKSWPGGVSDIPPAVEEVYGNIATARAAGQRGVFP